MKIALTVVGILLLTACVQQSTCQGNYLEFKSGECCLDANQNDICDQDEGTAALGRQESLDKVKSHLEDASGSEGVYKAIQESFAEKCYVKDETHQGVVWENKFNARCDTVEDCTDFYSSIGVEQNELEQIEIRCGEDGSTSQESSGDNLVECLDEHGVKLYGVRWSAQTLDQIEKFGVHLSFFIDCDVDYQACELAGVNTYPTWILPSGKRLEGSQEPSHIADLAAC